VAQSLPEQRASYPLAAYNFRVDVGGRTLSFARVSGLQREHQTLTYRHGLSFLEGERIAKFFIDKYVTVTLERGTTIGGADLYEWVESKDSRSLEIHLCDQTGAPVVSWRVAKALAVKLSASTYDAQTNEVAIETLELKAAGITLAH